MLYIPVTPWLKSSRNLLANKAIMLENKYLNGDSHTVRLLHQQLLKKIFFKANKAPLVLCNTSVLLS